MLLRSTRPCEMTHGHARMFSEQVVPSIIDDSRRGMSDIAFRTAPPIGGLSCFFCDTSHEKPIKLVATAEADQCFLSYNIFAQSNRYRFHCGNPFDYSYSHVEGGSEKHVSMTSNRSPKQMTTPTKSIELPHENPRDDNTLTETLSHSRPLVHSGLRTVSPATRVGGGGF